MESNRYITRAGVWTGLLILALIALTATLTIAKSGNRILQPDTASTPQSDDMSQALLTVSNMSCGGCVDTITKSLSTVPGVTNVSVNVAAGTTEVAFDPNRIEDHGIIAKVITNAGYPAKISQIFSAQELREQTILAIERAKTYIASVGRTDISRQDFTIELKHARKRYEQVYGKDIFVTEKGKQLFKNIKSQIVLRLIDEGIKLQEVNRAGFMVSKETINDAFNTYLNEKNTTQNQLKSDLAANDYSFNYFHKKFSNKVHLQRYLEAHVYGNGVDADARQLLYKNWITNARVLAQVTYYDKDLEKLVNASRTSSCSGGGSGGCSSSR